MCVIGKNLLVIGASSELERVIIKQLSDFGAILTIADKEITGMFIDNASFYTFDIFDNDCIEENIPKIIWDAGPFDGLLFCVTRSDFRPLISVKHDVLEKIMNENYFSFIDILRTLVKKKGLNQGASIVALSSISSIKGMKAKMAFCASKAALDASVRCLALELAPKSIRINSIQKGIVKEDFSKDNIQSITVINEGAELNKQPLGVTDGKEIANTIAFLMGDNAITITGTSIVIDGGFTI